MKRRRIERRNDIPDWRDPDMPVTRGKGTIAPREVQRAAAESMRYSDRKFLNAIKHKRTSHAQG